MAAISPGSQNLLLRALSREDYGSLAPHLKHVALSLHDVLVERNKTNHHVYFPLAGLIAVHTIFADHVSLDMVGKEGMVGVFIAAGVNAPQARIAVQGSGSAMRVSAKQFRILANRSGSLQRHMHRYTCLMLKHSAQTSRCNGLHTVAASRALPRRPVRRHPGRRHPGRRPPGRRPPGRRRRLRPETIRWQVRPSPGPLPFRPQPEGAPAPRRARRPP